MPFTARVSDNVICPMVTLGVPPIPNVGGPIMPPGAATVLIGGLSAANLGGMTTCVGPPGSIAKRSSSVQICGKRAARVSDTAGHGGIISPPDCPTVLIGGWCNSLRHQIGQEYRIQNSQSYWIIILVRLNRNCIL